jgi:hypothetical protein
MNRALLKIKYDKGNYSIILVVLIRPIDKEEPKNCCMDSTY